MFRFGFNLNINVSGLSIDFRGPPRFEGDRPRFGDRDGYRGGPRGETGEFGDKSGAPPAFQPSFRVNFFLN